jgi:hypothetical protein
LYKFEAETFGRRCSTIKKLDFDGVMMVASKMGQIIRYEAVGTTIIMFR